MTRSCGLPRPLSRRVCLAVVLTGISAALSAQTLDATSLRGRVVGQRHSALAGGQIQAAGVRSKAGSSL